MSNNYVNPPLTAKNGHTLEVIIAGRVSNPGPGKQSILSLDDQESMHLEWLKANTDLRFNVTVVAGSGSGEFLDREEYLRLLDLVATGKYDLVLTEDLGRLVRRIHAHLFAEHCVDHGTRLISKNDHVDTLVEGWEDRSIFSAWHHERSNRDTSDRIKRAHRGRFTHGGALRRLIPGVIKPPGAKSDEDLSMDPYWQDIYLQWFERLDKDQTFADVADWLNSINAPTGCNKKKYDCQLVGQRTRNKLLKGIRERNNYMSVRVNKTGRRKTVKAPAELRQERFCPNLVFIQPTEYDRILAKVEKQNVRYSSKNVRLRSSRKRTRYPGQSTYCGICGHLFVFGAHGQKHFLMCDGARRHRCWNGVSLNGPFAAEKAADIVAGELEHLEGFTPAFEAELNREAMRLNDLLDSKIRAIDAEFSRAERAAENLLEELRSGNRSQLVRDDLARIEAKLSQIRCEREEVELTRVNRIVLPSAEELRQLYRDTFRGLAVESFEFAQQLRRLVPRMVVYPVQLVDGGRIYLRGAFRLQLSALIPDTGTRAAVQHTLDKVVVVDLFELPQRARHREQIMELRETMTEREVAEILGITITAAQNAAALQRTMDALGASDPFVRVTVPPVDSKHRRHLHKRYKFEPLPDAGQL